MSGADNFDDWQIVCWSRNLCSASSYCDFIHHYSLEKVWKDPCKSGCGYRWTQFGGVWRRSLDVEMRNLDIFNDSVLQIRVFAFYLVLVGVVAKNVSQSMNQKRLTSLNNGYKLLRSRLRSIQKTRDENFTTTVRLLQTWARNLIVISQECLEIIQNCDIIECCKISIC